MRRFSGITPIRCLTAFFFTLSILLLSSNSGLSAARKAAQAGWRFEIESGKKRPSVLAVINICKKEHRFRAKTNAKYLSFVQPADSILVGPNSTKEVGIQFDATGLKPKVYSDEMTVECIDCKSEKTCHQDRDVLVIEMTVITPPSRLRCAPL